MTPPDGRARKGALRTIIVVCLVGAIAFVANLAIAMSLKDVSLFDEGVHYDYVVELHDGVWPATAAQVTQQTLDEISCRGTQWFPTPHCGALTPADAPNHNANYVISYPPTYYAYANVVGELLAPFGVSLFDAGRVASVLLFSVGTALVTWALVRLGVRRWMAAAASVSLVLLTLGYRLGATVTPDSAYPLVGAAALLVLSIRARWWTRLVIATAIGVGIAFIKPSFVPSACLVVLVAAVGAPLIERGTFRSWWRLGWRRWLGTVAAAAAPLLVAVGWQAFRMTQLAPGETQADGGLNHSLLYTPKGLVQVIVDGLVNMTNPFGDPVIPHVSHYWAVVYLVGNAIFFCGVGLVAIWHGPAISVTARVLALAGIVGYIATAAYTAATMWISFHSEGVNGRYAMPLTPLFIGAIAIAVIPLFRRRWQGAALTVVATVVLALFVLDAVGTTALVAAGA